MLRPFLAFLLLSLSQVDSFTSCDNGGVREDVKCTCDSFWRNKDGETTGCTQIVCLNGGYPNKTKPICICPDGYYGVHCDAVRTADAPLGAFEYAETTSFNVYLHNELTDYFGFNAWKQFKGVLNNDAVLQTSYYAKFNLFTSDTSESDVTVTGSTANDFNSFKHNLDSITPARPSAYECFPKDFAVSLLEALKGADVRHGSLLVVTQHPPPAGSLVELIEYLVAFDIRVSVLFPYDDVLLACDDSALDPLRDLAYRTDGEFVSVYLDDNEDSPAAAVLVRASHHPQGIAFGYSASSCDVSLSFNTDFSLYPYYVSVRGGSSFTGECVSVPMQLVASSYPEGISYYSFQSAAGLPCTIRVTGDGTCSVRVLSVGVDDSGNANGLSLFRSFVALRNLDTQYALPQGEDLHLTLRVIGDDGLLTPVHGWNDSSKGKYGDSDFDLVLRSHATFDLISSVPFSFDVTSPFSWVTLNLDGTNVNGGGYSFTRYLSVLPATTPLPPASPGTTASTDSTMSTAPPASTTTAPPECEIFSSPSTPSIILAYSNNMASAQWSDFSIQATSNTDGYKKFGSLLFDGKGLPVLMTTDDVTIFKQNMYTSSPKNDNNPDFTRFFSDALPALKRANIDQNALISVVVTNKAFADAAQDDKGLGAIVATGARIVVWADKSLPPIAGVGATGQPPYERLAAVTGGHLIAIDQTARSGLTEDTYFAKTVNWTHSNIGTRRLVRMANLDLSPSTNTYSNTIKLVLTTQSAFDGLITISVNFDDLSSLASPAYGHIIFTSTSTDERVVVELSAVAGSPSTSLMSGTASLAGGVVYDTEIVMIGLTDFHSVFFRLWRTPSEQEDFELKFVDMEDKDADADDYNGAAARISLRGNNIDKVLVSYLTAAGTVSPLRDAQQSVVGGACVDGFLIPFFCTSTQDGTRLEWIDAYTVQIDVSSSDGSTVSIVRPFICGKGNDPESDCKNKDENGDYVCTGQTPPFFRGPSNLLLDCSDNGFLQYDKDAMSKEPIRGPYKCVCDRGFDGDSCQESHCDALNNNPGVLDLAYRTLSFVYTLSADACSLIGLFGPAAGKALFEEGSDFSNIWQFQFTILTDNGKSYHLYRGSDYEEFFKAFSSFGEDGLTDCGDSTGAVVNLTEVYNEATHWTAHDRRGLLILFFDSSMGTSPFTVTADQSFYDRAQLFHQHTLVMFDGATEDDIPEDVIRATSATGGATLVVDTTIETPVLPENIHALATSSVGWATIQLSGTESKFTTSAADAIAVLTSPAGSLTVSQKTTIFKIAQADEYTFSNLQDDVQLTVFTTDGTPFALLPRGIAVDDNDAAATDKGDGVILSFAVSEGKDITSESEIWRKSDRTGCTFNKQFTPFTNEYNATAQPFLAKFKAASTDSTTITIPIPISSVIQCDSDNGDFDDKLGICQCKNGFSGASCSIPPCTDGTLSAWKDACMRPSVPTA